MYYEKKTRRFECIAHRTITFENSSLHFHNEVEIIINLGHGAKANAFINSKKYSFDNEYDAVIVTPGQIHTYETIKEGLFMTFIFPPEFIPRLQNSLLTKHPANPVFNLKELGINDTFMNFWSSHGELPDNIKHLRSSLIIGFLNTLMAHLFYKVKFIEDDSNSELLHRIILHLVENYSEQINLSDLSDTFKTPPSVISKAFNATTGITFPSFLNWIRVTVAADMLANTNNTITSISYKVGFRTIRNFNRAFIEFYGTTPSKYRTENNVS